MKSAKILNTILTILFVEAIAFAPVVLMVASDGNDVGRTMKYAVPFLMALIPYIIRKRTNVSTSSYSCNKFAMGLALIAGLCFLICFTGLVLVSCAGHPPW